MKEMSLLFQNVLLLWGMLVHMSYQGGKGLNTFSRKGCPGREVYWLNTRGLSRYFISMETSRFLCYVTGYHGPHNGVLWLCVSRTDRPWLGAGSNACHSQLHKFLVFLNLFQPYQEFCLVPRCTHLTLKPLHFPFSVHHTLPSAVAPSAGCHMAGGPLGDILCSCCVV